MGAKTVYFCDRPNCKEMKKGSNNWWLLYFDGDGAAIFTWPQDDNVSDRKMACSKECVQKMIEIWMDSKA